MQVFGVSLENISLLEGQGLRYLNGAYANLMGFANPTGLSNSLAPDWLRVSGAITGT